MRWSTALLSGIFSSALFTVSLRAGSDSRKHKARRRVVSHHLPDYIFREHLLSECWRLEFQHYESSLSVDFKSSIRVSFRVLFSFDF